MATISTTLALGACTADDQALDTDRSPPPTPAVTSPVASPGPDGASPGVPSPPVTEVPELAGTCTLQAPGPSPAKQVRLAYPKGWRISDTCRWFDPSARSIPEDTEPALAVSWRVADASFARAADVDDEVRDAIRYVGARSGYQAVRITGVATGRGQREEGQPVLLWLVDLDPGTDEAGGVLVGSAHHSEEVSFDVARRALDRMAGSILVQPPAVGADQPIVVTREEGGGSPFTVTSDGRCFQLHVGAPDGPVADGGCALGPLEDGFATVLLESEDGLPVLAGLADPLVERVTVPAASGLFGASTVSLEGASVFAMHVRQPPFEVTGKNVDGETVATTRVH